jgi:PAS domain S-box-containing protein
MAGLKNNPKRNPGEVAELRARLDAAEDALRAIRSGQVDAVVVSGSTGQQQVFPLTGAENAYRIFVEAMTEGAVTLAYDGAIVYCNRSFAEMMRVPGERLIGTSIFRFVPDAERATLDGMLARAQQAPAKAELQLRNEDGEYRPVFVSVRSFQEFGARALCMVVTDLTEQKRQERIVAAGKLARTILEQALEAIAVCDEQGRVILASNALHDLCDCNPLFQPFDSVLALELPRSGGNAGDGERRRFTIREVLDGRSYRSVDVLLRRPSGELAHLLLGAARVKFPGAADNVGCVVTLYNIEERKRAEEALRHSERLAATGRLAATIAHEINNPLEGVTNLLYLIEQTPGLDPQVLDYANMAQSELLRVGRITKQTLAFHRESSAPVIIDLAELIESVVYLYERKMKDKAIELALDVTFRGRLSGFPTELRQVLVNLFENAVEASPHGGRLRLRAYPSREWNNSRLPGVRIVIADRGIGIAREQYARIFDPFFTTKGEKGTGLGLWVTQSIVQKHGGSVRLRSSTRPERNGTVFSVFLPVPAEGTTATADRTTSAA